MLFFGVILVSGPHVLATNPVKEGVPNMASIDTPKAALLHQCRKKNSIYEGDLHDDFTEESDFSTVDKRLYEGEFEKDGYYYESKPSQLLMEKEHCAVCQIIVENHNRLKGQRVYTVLG